jgi:hypothetical protein
MVVSFPGHVRRCSRRVFNRVCKMSSPECDIGSGSKVSQRLPGSKKSVRFSSVLVCARDTHTLSLRRPHPAADAIEV